MSIILLVFLIACGIQITYFLLYAIGIAKINTEVAANHEPVSIIIAARNEKKNLQKLLPLLLSQEYPEFEIIVANDQSTDDSDLFLKEFAALHPEVRVLDINENPAHISSKKFALTLAIKAAKNDLLLLTDADCQPESNQWITKMAGAAQGKSYVLGFSPYQIKKGLLNYFIRFETLLTSIQYLSFSALGHPYMGVGRNLAYRKSDFLAHKGFNGFSQLVGGDDDLLINKYANGSNTVCCINKDAHVISLPKETWKTFYRQKRRHLHVGKHYKTIDKIILGLFSLSYIMSWLLLPLVLIETNELSVTLAGFLVRILVVHIVFFLSTKKLKVTFNVWGLLLLDLIFAGYYIFTATAALFTKKITWS